MYNKNDRNKSNTTDRNDATRAKKNGMFEHMLPKAAVFLSAMLLGLLLPGCAAQTEGESGMDLPPMVYSESYWHGPFDEVWTSNYYLVEDGCGQDDVPTEGWTAPDGTRYVCESVDGPVETDFGSCWEAVFRPME